MLTELTIKIVTEQDPDELDSKIREALMGVADISEIIHEGIDRFPNEETLHCFNVIRKNPQLFKGFRDKTSLDLEKRVRELNDMLFELDPGEDEGLEWVCFTELLIELKKEKWFI